MGIIEGRAYQAGLIGEQLHREPLLLNYPRPSACPTLLVFEAMKGMLFTIIEWQNSEHGQVVLHIEM